jgi:hypothetical protein
MNYYDSTPYIYTSSGGDDAVAIKALIEAGERWIQCASSSLIFDTPCILTDGGVPAHGFRFEPVDGLATILINVDGIGRDPVTPSNPSYAGFEYNGGFATAGYLASPSSVGDLQITVNNGALYTVGQWVFISDASTNPGTTLQPLDGPMETRQILVIAGNILTVNEALDRAHIANTIVAKCVPIKNVYFKSLTFTGDAGNGVHVHASHDGYFKNITTNSDWSGGTMLLIDNAGIGNLIEDCYCNGSVPGLSAGQQVWGVAIEGQKRTRVVNSGGEYCGAGFTANYCIDCNIFNPPAHRNNVNVGIYSKSIRTSIITPYVANANNSDTVISGDCTDCVIVDAQAYIDPEESETTKEWRSYPVATSVGATDSFLVVTENNAGFQVSKSVVVCREADGSISGNGPWYNTGVNYGPMFVGQNTNQIWGWGMSGAPNSRNWVLVNATLGDSQAITVDYSNNNIAFVGSINIPTAKTYNINSLQVVAARKTGWAADTGTSKRTANATYATGSALSVSASYTPAEVTAIITRLALVEAALQNSTQSQKALKDDLISHGLIGT